MRHDLAIRGQKLFRLYVGILIFHYSQGLTADRMHGPYLWQMPAQLDEADWCSPCPELIDLEIISKHLRRS